MYLPQGFTWGDFTQHLIGNRRRSVSSQAFVPSDLSGLILWYKMDDMVADDGDNVGSWADASGTTDDSGNDKNLAELAAGYDNACSYDPPTYESAAGDLIGTKPVVRFTQDDVGSVYQCLYCPDRDNPLGHESAATIFAVVRPNSSTGANSSVLTICEGGDAAFDYLAVLGIQNVTGTNYAWVYFQAGASIDQDHYGDTELVDDTAYYIAWGVEDSVAYHIWVNGTEQTLTKAGSHDNDGSWLGLLTNEDAIGVSCIMTDPVTYHFHGDIAEIIMYNTYLSDSDRAKVHNYLATKFTIS